MRKDRLRCKIFKGNNQRFLEKSEGSDMSREEYLSEICKHEIIFIDNNMLTYFKHRKIKFPEGCELSYFPETLAKTNENTEDFSVSIPKGYTEILYRKAALCGLYNKSSIGNFIDRVCAYPILILNGSGAKK